MKRRVSIVIILIIILLSITFVRFYTSPIIEETNVIVTAESNYLDWNSICAEQWDELIINQTDTTSGNQQPHSISFYKEGQIIKTVKILETVVFWIDENQLVTVLRVPRINSTFIYQGIRHLSSELTYDLFSIMTIGDGFFAKCYTYKNEDDYCAIN